MNSFEDILRGGIIKDIKVCESEYLPPRLRHREEELKALAIRFKPLINNPGESFIRVLITGKWGVGKTALARFFGVSLLRIASEKKINLKYIHVNCHHWRTLSMIASFIASNLERFHYATRGVDHTEIFNAIFDHLNKRDMYLVITLDEVQYLERVEDSLYYLLRLYEGFSHKEKRRFHFIITTRNAILLNELFKKDPSLKDYLLAHSIHLRPYTSDQLYDILSDRAELFLKEGTIGEEELRYIADLVGVDKGGSGSARMAIQLLCSAAEFAEAEGAQRVTVEHVRKAYSKYNDAGLLMVEEELPRLSKHEKIFLLAIVDSLLNSDKELVKIGDVEARYKELAEEMGEKPRGHTQLHTYLQKLRRYGIIRTSVSSLGRGRSTVIMVDYPLRPLRNKLIELLRDEK